MKKYLFIALAALGLAACEEKIGDQPHSGEVEQSYIAINLMSADLDTRADEYDLGTEAERAISSAYFFFFNANGGAFTVNQSGEAATAPSGDTNYLTITIDNGTSNNSANNVSDIKDAVLILNTYKGLYPDKVVAVLNWVPSNDKKTYTLDELKEQLATIVNDSNGFVMSNSVYMHADGTIADAVPITADNIKTDANAALAAPVNIYVERVAAKVIVSASGDNDNTDSDIIFNTTKKSDLIDILSGSTQTDVYVKLLGWELYNDYNQSYIIKGIDNTWTEDNLGFLWNDRPKYRSYWTKSQNSTHSDTFAWSYNDTDKSTKGFKTEYGFNIAAQNIDNTMYTYCGENTNQVTKSGDVITSDPRTKVILKGQLMQKNGENYEPLELARWYGNEYAGNENLRKAVVNSLRHTLFYKESDSKYTSVNYDDIICVNASSLGGKAYEVIFLLSTTGKAKEWYKYSSEDGYQYIGNTSIVNDNETQTNEYLKSVEPAILYSNGQTYYIVDIEHLGKDDKGTKYGIVRNHVYQIDIKSITGYGSPGFSDIGNIVTPPEYPEYDDKTYVSAKINVLSWKVVKQEVNIVK